MFLNFTNHPCAEWAPAQRQAASQYGPVRDLPFPAVPAAAGSDTLERMANEWANRIAQMHPNCVLCQGEMTLTYRVTRRLLAMGIPVVAACSERRCREWTDAGDMTHRETTFEFVRFRLYEKPALGLASEDALKYTKDRQDPRF